MNVFERNLIARAAVAMAGNPFRQVADHSPHVVYATRPVRVIKDGWYHNGAAVKLGATIRMSTLDATGARALGRVEYT